MRLKKTATSFLWLLVASFFAAGCSAKFNKSLPTALTNNPALTNALQLNQSFMREVSGAKSIATSANFKLKGVSVGGIANHSASSAGFKTKDAAAGAVQ